VSGIDTASAAGRREQYEGELIAESRFQEIEALNSSIEVHHALSGALKMLSSAHAPDAAGIVESSAFELPTRIVRLWWTEKSLQIRFGAL
jgi:hypothetical protein